MNRRGTVRHRSRPASVAEPTILPDSPLEEAGFELFVPLRINASPSGWSRARIPHGAPEGSFSVAGPLVRIHLPPGVSHANYDRVIAALNGATWGSVPIVVT